MNPQDKRALDDLATTLGNASNTLCDINSRLHADHASAVDLKQRHGVAYRGIQNRLESIHQILEYMDQNSVNDEVGIGSVVQYEQINRMLEAIRDMVVEHPGLIETCTCTGKTGPTIPSSSGPTCAQCGDRIPQPDTRYDLAPTLIKLAKQKIHKWDKDSATMRHHTTHFVANVLTPSRPCIGVEIDDDGTVSVYYGSASETTQLSDHEHAELAHWLMTEKQWHS